MTDRRTFLVVGVALFAPSRAFGQTGKPPSVGFIVLAGRDAALIEAFETGLRENGLVPGATVRVGERYGDGSRDRMRGAVATLVAAGTKVFVTAGDNATRMIQDVSPDVAIVVASLESLQTAGVSGSIARPAGNVTGFATLGDELIEKRFELLREMLPGLKRVMAVTNPGNRNHGLRLPFVRRVGERFGIDVVTVEVTRPDEVVERIAAGRLAGAEAAVFLRDFLFESIRPVLTNAALAARLPSVFDEGHYVRIGGLVSYAPSRPDLFRRSAAYVAKIIAGARPTDLPIQQPTKFELAINLKTAKALGLTIPPAILLRADEVIE